MTEPLKVLTLHQPWATDGVPSWQPNPEVRRRDAIARRLRTARDAKNDAKRHLVAAAQLQQQFPDKTLDEIISASEWVLIERYDEMAKLLVELAESFEEQQR